MSNPVEALEQSIGHQCQNGHGVLADVVLVQLATGETDVICQPCLIMLMSAAISTMVQNLTPEQLAAEDPATVAMQAAAAALAAQPD
jgi:hypothetical protein